LSGDEVFCFWIALNNLTKSIILNSVSIPHICFIYPELILNLYKTDMSDMFDPKKIIDFSKDYYAILGLVKENLPLSSIRKDKVELANIIERAFRKQARFAHPDFGGSKEAFLDLVRARRIIEDPLLRNIYNQGEFIEAAIVEGVDGFAVDWSKLGTYRKGTPEDTVGYSLFLEICNRKKELELVPAFIPELHEHNYEWDFVIQNHSLNIKNLKLVISIVNDEAEVLRLTDGDKISESLPFKIYVCCPKVGVKYIREQNQIVAPTGRIMANGAIKKVAYNDHIFLETTLLEEAKNYLDSDKFKEDLFDFKTNGSNQDNVTKKLDENSWMNQEEMKNHDAQLLQKILKMKTFTLEEDEHGADFLEKLSEKSNRKQEEDKPELPF
jgi:hypothetical protein